MNDAPLRQRVVRLANAWIGTPYRHQAAARGQGADCLGLVRGIWCELYGHEPERLPPYAPDWMAQGTSEMLADAAARHLVRVSDAAPGTVLMYRLRSDWPVSHCGICVGEQRFVHAYSRRCVTSSTLSGFWQARLAAIFDYPSVPGVPE